MLVLVLVLVFCLGNFGARASVLSSFWVPVWCPGVESCRQQLETSKFAPFSSGLPVVAKRLPPYVLAVRGDLRVFVILDKGKNANHDRNLEPGRATGKLEFAIRSLFTALGVFFARFLAPGPRTAPVAAWGVGGMGGAGGDPDFAR